MPKKPQKPASSERDVTVRELVESELDLIVGGAPKQTEKKKEEKKTDSAKYLKIKLTNVMISS